MATHEDRQKEKQRVCNRDWYRRHRKHRKQHVQRINKTRQQALAEYKLERGCAICGYKGHPDALEFDHLPGTEKKDNVGSMRVSWAAVMKEVAKCQILCGNCHRIETANRRREAKQAKKRAAESGQLKLFA